MGLWIERVLVRRPPEFAVFGPETMCLSPPLKIGFRPSGKKPG